MRSNCVRRRGKASIREANGLVVLVKVVENVTGSKLLTVTFLP